MNAQSSATLSLDNGRSAFEELYREVHTKSVDWNEAETRFHFIDRLLVECLGWPRHVMSLERRADDGYADYLLGEPVVMIWEAKRQGKHFDIPVETKGRHLQSISSLLAVDTQNSDAIQQVQAYCVARGVEFAVICNGHQLIAFLAVRIGHSPLEGRALVFRDLEHMRADFAKMWQHLSPDAIAERRLHRLLTTGSDVSLPPKPSSSLMRFPIIRYQTPTQSTLRSIGELFIEDIPASEDVEEEFLSQCYCGTGALSRDSLLSQKLLAARYAALFPEDEAHPRVQPASTQSKPLEITPDIMTEALARRPIILLGDVGVGKTSFLKQLMLLKASKNLRNP